MSCRALILGLFLVAGCSLVEHTGPNPDKRPLHLSWAQDLDPVYSTGNLPIALQSPTVHDGMVFVGDGRGEMHAYDAHNGREVWKERDNSGYHAAPVLFQDYLIYGTIEGRVYARHYLSLVHRN